MPNSTQSTAEKWKLSLKPANATIREIIQTLDKTALQIVMIIDSTGKLLGTITDGDIRRGLLKGASMEAYASEVMNPNPFVVPPEFSRDLVIQLMAANKIQQLPVVNESGLVVGLHLLNDLLAPSQRKNLFVIMAGGKGQRLRPHTENCPKPMLHVQGKPMLEHILLRAKAEGFVNFCISLHYLGHMIQDYFGDGSGFGLNINYVNETLPLGTAGALGLIPEVPAEPFLVSNGDVLTDIKYGDILDYHLRHSPSLATMAVRQHEIQNPYGVVKTSGVDIVGFEEKPVFRSHINAGIYAMDPKALQYIEKNTPLDMPSLFQKIQSDGRRTIVYPMHEPWLDVGRLDDLEKAQNP